MALDARTGRITARADLGPALEPDLRRRLSNGLTNVLMVHVTLAPERGGDPAALSVREIDVLYDVWEESFGVTIKDARTPRGRLRSFSSYDELRLFLADARDLDLGPAAALGSASWVVLARVEVNPISRELLERTRELLANPAAAGRGGGPSRSVLGAMASYLLRAADPGATVRHLRSAPFTAREVTR